MAQTWGNLAKMTITSVAGGGAGTITLNAAASGYVTFATSGITDGQVVTYTAVRASDGAKETGYGTYTASGTTLTRNLLLSTTGSLLSLSSADTVEVVQAAEQLINPIITPQGRLTLVSGVPVMTSDQTAKGTVYYTPYVGALVPIYNGAFWRARLFSELTLTLNSSDNVSGSIYDIFVFDNAGTLTIGTGPAWSSTTSRGTGAGTTQLTPTNGLQLNAVSITLKNNGSTVGTPAAGTATCVGTIYCTGNGQTGMAFAPPAANGGANPILGLYNAYNRVPVRSASKDNTTSWTYNSSTWRAANNSNSNRITWVDGLQQSSVRAMNQISVNTGTGAAGIGINLDSTSANPGSIAQINQVNGFAVVANQSVEDAFLPQLGLHYVQAVESSLSGTVTFDGSRTSPTGQFQVLAIDLMM